MKAGDTSVGEIPVVSVVQNTETGHTDISVGGVTTPVASVEEVSQLEQKVTEYPYLINSTPEANKRIRELYLIGLDPTKRYYFKFLRYYSSGPYIQGRIYSFTQSDHSDEAEVARTPDSAPLKGIAQFGERNSSGVSGYVVYDFETSDTANFTPEVNVSVCSVLAFSPYIAQYLKKIATADINSGAVTTEKIADGAVTTEKIVDGAVTKEKFLPDVPFVTNNSTNLINPNGAGVESGKYLIVSTGLPTGLNAGYTTSDFFPVMPGVGYVTSDDEVRYVCFYDAEKVYLGSASAINGVKTTNFTTPAGAYLCRVSLGNNHNFADLQIAIGVDNTDFFQFKDKYADTDKQLIGQPGNFSAIRLSGTIAAGGNAHANERLSTEKNTILIAKINGTISSCVFGVGWREESPYHYYSAYWVEVTPTRLIIHWYDNNSDVTLHTFEHGINLDDKTTVCIQTSCNNTKQSNIRLINGKGDVFAKTIFWEGLGRLFFNNWGTESLDVDIRLFSRDLTKPVWIFGDSYVTYSDNRRWTYYLVNRFITDWLLVHRPGAAAAEMYNDLLCALNIGTAPKYVLWCLGMNGNPDVDSSTPDTTQKGYIDSVIALCKANNIEPILMTIPSVPNLPHTAINNYIRSTGCRYVDVETAVGADANGNWTTGLLSADNVHPTILGAKVICAAVLAEFPEIAIAPATPFKDATISAPGLMSAADKSKLDGISITSGGVFSIGGYRFQLTPYEG